MTVVHWARHGENAANVSRRFSHRIFDGDLTDRGVRQAEQLAAALQAGNHQFGLAGTDDAIVVAHGASIRAALPALTGQPDPGADLPTGAVASLLVTLEPSPPASIALVAWP